MLKLWASREGSIMSDLHSTSTQEFNNRYQEAIQVVDGPHPERSVQLLEDLLMEAFKFHVIDDQIIGGIIMWVPGSMMFFIGALVLIGRWLQDQEKTSKREKEIWMRKNRASKSG